jgi:hypothetical protein
MENVMLLEDKNSKAWDFANKIRLQILSPKCENVPLYDLPISKFRNGGKTIISLLQKTFKPSLL